MFSDLSNTTDVTELCGHDEHGAFTWLPLDTKRDPSMTRTRARTIPVARHIDSWAREVSSRHWERDEAVVRPWRHGFGRSRITVTGVRVRILLLDFNARTGVYAAAQRYAYSLQCPETEIEHGR
jgi:hypothetical protein